MAKLYFYTHNKIVAGCYGFMLVISVSVCLSVMWCLSVFSFPDNNVSKYQWIFNNMVCVLILWRSGPEVIKLFSYSTQLSMKLVLFINLKILTKF